MKRITKKFVAILLTCGMLFAVASCAAEEGIATDSTATDTAPSTSDSESESKPVKESEKNENDEAKEKIMDIYIIAGQSNASGHTYISNAQELYDQTGGALRSGYSNVHYSGHARYAGNLTNTTPWGKAKLGLGFTPEYMGPEAGMAEALSAYYNSNTGLHAGIIKMAHGGTSLLNVTDDDNNKYGNWVSPSYAAELGVEYSGATGGIYRDLLAQVKKSLAELKAYGFTDVNIKAMYWMQGEQDRTNPTEYKKSFKYFIEDLRADLSEVVKEYTGTDDDRGASEMKIFVGTISENFYIQSTGGDPTVNKKFVEMQKTLPGAVEGCYIVDNSKRAMNEYVNGGWIALCSRSGMGHWNQKNAFEIGVAVGNGMLDNCAN